VARKSLAVGEGYTQAPKDLSGGDALSQEDLKSKKKKEPVSVAEHSESKITEKPLKKLSKEMYKSNIIDMLDKLQVLYPDVSRSVIWNTLSDRLTGTFPSLKELLEDN